jgi:hypothetical protein
MKKTLLSLLLLLSGCAAQQYEPTMVMHADTSFTEQERGCMIDAAYQWSAQTNGIVDTRFEFDYDSKSTWSKINHARHHRVERWLSDDENTKEADKAIGGYILGQASGDIHSTVSPAEMRLVVDRFESDRVCKLVVLHELGHVYGMDHIEGPENIMFKQIGRQRNTCLRTPDLREFCKHNECGKVELKGCE